MMFVSVCEGHLITGIEVIDVCVHGRRLINYVSAA